MKQPSASPSEQPRFDNNLYGGWVDARLPPLYDSVVPARERLQQAGRVEEVLPGAWFVRKARPLGLTRRLRHALLVLQGRAIAVQFAEDHFRMAGVATKEKPPREGG